MTRPQDSARADKISWRITEEELAQDLAGRLDAVAASGEPLLVARHNGRGSVVLLSQAAFEGWRETVHLLSSPRNAERLLRSIGAVAADRRP